MRKQVMVAVLAGMAVAAVAQQAQEITFFSNPGYSGARFTVTGPRTILDLPFTPRSAMMKGGGSWEMCPGRDYAGPCRTINDSQRDLNYATIRSIRPANAVGISPWREIARLNVRDRQDRDRVSVNDGRVYRQVMVCAERNTVRIRRAEVQLGNGTWQRLFLPVALSAGACSKGIDLLGGARRIRALQFDYEAWSPGIARGTISVRALPNVTPQPR